MNAIIMAAGTASRFFPISEETPKGLLDVRGEILIERQIRQLREAGISDITVVTGYKAELFAYLKDKFDRVIYIGSPYSMEEEICKRKNIPFFPTKKQQIKKPPKVMNGGLITGKETSLFFKLHCI